MDKFKAMNIFIGIVEAGSLTAAAERLGVSLAAVVRSLAALEESLGVRLLNRSTRRIALTEEGRDYLERSRRLLADLADMENAVAARRARPSGRLTITAPVMFGRLHVAPVVTDFLAEHPEMSVELLLVDRVLDLLDESIDLALRIGPLPDSGLVAVPVGCTRRVTCASPAYLARHGRPTHPAELAGHAVIRLTGLGDGHEWHFERIGERGSEHVRVPVRSSFATNQVDVALDACRKGIGCGRFLAYQVQAAEGAGELQRVLDDWAPPAVPVSLLYPHGRLLPSRVRAFVDWAVPRLRLRLTPGTPQATGQSHPLS